MPEVKTCEEYVLGELDRANKKNEALEFRNSDLERAITYSNSVIEIFKGLVDLKEVKNGQWIFAPKKAFQEGMTISEEDPAGAKLLIVLKPLFKKEVR